MTAYQAHRGGPDHLLPPKQMLPTLLGERLANARGDEDLQAVLKRTASDCHGPWSDHEAHFSLSRAIDEIARSCTEVAKAAMQNGRAWGEFALRSRALRVRLTSHDDRARRRASSMTEAA